MIIISAVAFVGIENTTHLTSLRTEIFQDNKKGEKIINSCRTSTYSRGNMDVVTNNYNTQLIKKHFINTTSSNI